MISNPPTGLNAGLNRFARAYLTALNVHFAAGCNADEIAASSKHMQDVYARFLRPPRYELYDLEADPYEFSNLADSAEHADTQKRLIVALKNWQDKMDDPFADPDFLERFARSQLDAIDSNYRGDKEFRWPYLDEVDR